MRGCTTRRWPLVRRNTACLARRPISSKPLLLSVRSRRAFDTRRSTSVFASRACAILQPSSRGASSRTMVSTSGSSGTRSPLHVPPADVPPVRLSLERNELCTVRALLARRSHGVTHSRYGEDPAAVHPQRAVRVAVGARVKHQRPGLQVARDNDLRAQLGLL